MHYTQALSLDSAAAEAWLREPGGADGLTHTRAESLGVDEDFGRDGEGFLATIDDVLTAAPHGLRHRADIAGVKLWLIADGEVLDQAALITVDLANGLRLATLHQDIKGFADRDSHAITATLSALAHIANQVSLLLDTYDAANPEYLTGTEASR